MTRVCVLVATVVIEDAACDDAEVFGKVQGGGDDEQAEEEEEHRVCVIMLASWLCVAMPVLLVRACRGGVTAE